MHVLQFVDDKYQYKSIILTCKFFWDFYQHGFMKGTERWDHDRFVQEFTKPISRNPNVTWDMIRNAPEDCWRLVVSANTNVTWDMIRDSEWPLY